MVKMIKFYQDKFYTVKAGIIVNRLVFLLGARLTGLSHVFKRKSNQVLCYGVKYKSQFKYFYYEILSAFCVMTYSQLCLLLSYAFVNIWNSTTCTSTECTFIVVCELA